MRNILVINDRSAAAANALACAVEMARNTNAGLIVWNNFEQPVPKKQYAAYKNSNGAGNYSAQTENILSGTYKAGEALPVIENFFTMNFSATHIAEFVVKHKVWMIIKGAPHGTRRSSVLEDDHTQAIINTANCPLLLIPDDADVRSFQKIVYTADLRYCRLEVLRHLVQLAEPNQADVMVAHIPAKGLPDVNEKYAAEVFQDEVFNNIKYDNLYFNHIKEKNLQTALDVMVDVMGVDLLVLVNHKFHFEEIIGPNLSGRLPEYLRIPLLVFPC